MNAKPSPTYWIDREIGERYTTCRLDNFVTSCAEHHNVVTRCRDYVMNFRRHFDEGRSIIFLGPTGTGKDHLAIAISRAICIGYQHDDQPMPPAVPSRVRFCDGRTLLDRIRSANFDRRHPGEHPDAIINAVCDVDLLTLSDPVPTKGALSEFDQQTLFKIVNGRYRSNKPICATINVATRRELEDRMGSQSADRLCDGAIVVLCNWESFRQSITESDYSSTQHPPPSARNPSHQRLAAPRIKKPSQTRA